MIRKIMWYIFGWQVRIEAFPYDYERPCTLWYMSLERTTKPK